MSRLGLSSDDDPLVQISTNVNYSVFKKIVEESRKEGKNKSAWLRDLILDKLKIK